MTDVVRYLLDGKPRAIHAPDPTRTVLEHLRQDLRRKGTKEGCAEGDCGACTVVVGELALTGDQVRWRAVNCCIQFLPMIHGKALVTVESLVRGDRLHPVQQAMVDRHASQCGFCTPGFVMSLYAKAIGGSGTDAPVDEMLAGNLCRCTGYGSILEAAARITPEAAPDVAEALRALQGGEMLAIEHRDAPGGRIRRWFAPRSLGELSRLTGAHPEAVLLAGATDVGLWVTKQHRAPTTLIFLGEVSELRTLDRTPDGLRVGAGVTYAEALPALGAMSSELEALVRRVGSVQVRNSGTVGGNIANGSPIGDMPPALIALGATLHLRRGEERRDLPLEDFFIDYGRQDRRPGEFVEAVTVAPPPEGSVFKVFKLSKRFDQDISAVCGAFLIEVEAGMVKTARVAFGGMAATPRRAPACESALIGEPWTRATVENAAAALGRDYQPITDMRASAAYRLLAARNLLRKVWAETRLPATTTRVLDYVEHG